MSESDVLVPDLIAPVVGHRAWRLVALAGPTGIELRFTALHAQGAQGIWSPDAPEAAPCLANGCGAFGGMSVADVLKKQHDCRCGYHAWKAPAENGSYMGKAKLTGDELAIVGGTAKLWGVVVEHEQGWRALHALPASIDEIRWNKQLKKRPDLRLELLAEIKRQYPRLVINSEYDSSKLPRSLRLLTRRRSRAVAG